MGSRMTPTTREIVEALAAENAELRAENARLKAALDRHGTGKVHIVPQGLDTITAIEHVQPDARPGDRLRFHDGEELVLSETGKWIGVPAE
jgi:hypothetical protein